MDGDDDDIHLWIIRESPKKTQLIFRKHTAKKNTISE
jgi:hypothetical protein